MAFPFERRCFAAPDLAGGPAPPIRRLQIVTADERLAEANTKTTMAIFGPSGVGKTSLLKTLPPEPTLCVDLEAGMKSVQGWQGDSIPIRCWRDAVDVACLIGGVDPSADPKGCRPRIAPGSSTRRSRPTSERYSPRSTGPPGRSDLHHQHGDQGYVRLQRSRTAAEFGSDSGRYLRQGDHDHPPG